MGFVCSKLDVNFGNSAKNWERVFRFLDNCIWIGWSTFLLLRRQCLSSAVNMLRNSPTIAHIIKRDIFQLCFNQNEEKYDMLKRFQQCLGPFNVLTVEGCSGTGLFRPPYLANHVFGSLQLWEKISYESDLFFQIFKIWCRFQKLRKN